MARDAASRAYQDAVAACVAERFKALGHPAGMLTQGALDALVTHAAGSIPRLRAALTGAIFLAATEDAPQLERSHVERAVAQAGAEMAPPDAADCGPAGLQGGHPAGRLRRPGLLALGLGGAAASVFALAAGLGLFSGPRAPAPIMAGIGAPAHPAVAGAGAAGKMPAPGPAPVAPAPLPPAAAVSTPALPPRGLPEAVARPAASVPTSIVLRYRRGDRWAQDKLKAASIRLRQAGYARITPLAWHGPDPAAPVTYFYGRDRAAAQALNAVVARARLLGGPGWWRDSGPRLAAGPAITNPERSSCFCPKNRWGVRGEWLHSPPAFPRPPTYPSRRHRR